MTAPRTVDSIVAGCLCTITFIYLTAVFNVIVPWLTLYTVPGLSNFLLLTTTTTLGLFTYCTCVFVDPGAVPKGYQHDVENNTSSAITTTAIQTKRSGQLRTCKKCNGAPKPPRTHHCKRCDSCVLRMDHHCKWTNNCIGHNNYKAFLLMVIYLTAAATHALALFLVLDSRLVASALGLDEYSKSIAALGSSEDTHLDTSTLFEGNSSTSSSNSNSSLTTTMMIKTTATTTMPQQPSIGRKVGWGNDHFWLHAAIQILATTLSLPIVVGLVLLLVWNGYLFLHNMTTIEYHEGVRTTFRPHNGMGNGRSGGNMNVSTSNSSQIYGLRNSSSSNEGGTAGHVFDLGAVQNIHSICGDSVIDWLLPVRSGGMGDGTVFETVWDQQEQLRIQQEHQHH